MTDKFAEAFHRIHRQFASGNSTDVERASVRKEDWEAILPELCYKALPDHFAQCSSTFVKVLMTYHNSLSLYDGWDLVRLIGYEEDDSDCYYKVIGCDTRNLRDFGKVRFLTAIGGLHPLVATLPDKVYARMEANLAMVAESNGVNCGPVKDDFTVKYMDIPAPAGELL